jgi:hypothetical protein
VEVGKACGGASGGNGWPMVAAHGDPWFTGEKERRRGGGRRVLGEAVARAWQDSEERKEARGMERTTRGRKGSRRWTAAACTAAAGGGAAPAAEQEKQRSRGQRGFRGKRREEEVRRTYVQN